MYVNNHRYPINNISEMAIGRFVFANYVFRSQNLIDCLESQFGIDSVSYYNGKIAIKKPDHVDPDNVSQKITSAIKNAYTIIQNSENSHVPKYITLVFNIFTMGNIIYLDY